MKQNFMTGDPGAVEHVLKKDEADWFPSVPTAMFKAGIGLTATNGSNIKKYG